MSDLAQGRSSEQDFGEHNSKKPRTFWLQGIVLLSLLGFYLLIFLSYRPYEIDNPWFLSFSYNTCIEHINTDQFMQIKYPAGMDGTQYFGRIAAFVQCSVLNRFEWQEWPAEMLTAVLITAALGLWCLKLKRLGYSKTFITAFLVWTGLSEPAVSAANRFRYESVSFFLLSLGLLLVASESLFWGALAATLAIEVEPIALSGLIPLVVLACTSRKLGLRGWSLLAAGGTAGTLVYVCLHAKLFRDAGHLVHVAPGAGGELGGFVAAYFTDRIRHLPELFVFAIALVMYWMRRNRLRPHYCAISAALILLFSFVVSHGNPAYMIFLYPFLVVMALSAFQVEMRQWLILIIVLVYFSSQYAVLAYINRGQGYRTADIRKVSDVIQSIADEQKIDDAKMQIYGDYGLWFAHPHYYVAASVTTLNGIHDADLYLCFDRHASIVSLQPRDMLLCPDILQRVALRYVRSIDVRGNTLHFYVRQDKVATDKLVGANLSTELFEGVKP